ncbi:MAG: phosphatidylglycerophosphatase A [Candidatus Cloacimonetes bacterium]|nr:phosphatidylglycerophosphatase A [Candidatus Cloacimonadota bacterium]
MIKERISLMIATCLGTGYFPKMPGTAGSALAAMVYIILPAAIFSSISGNLLFLLLILILFIILIPFVNVSEKILGHDNGKIVIDEFLGYMTATVFLPKSLTTALAAFVFFRLYDILKPEPVNALQKLPGGFGVMADDLMAGIYANISSQIVFRILI